MSARGQIAPLLPGIAVAVGVTAYVIVLLGVESQTGIAALLAAGAVAVLAAARFGVAARMGRAFGKRDNFLNLLVVLAIVVLTVFSTRTISFC